MKEISALAVVIGAIFVGSTIGDYWQPHGAIVGAVIGCLLGVVEQIYSWNYQRRIK